MSSTYINQQRKNYALYVLGERAIPHITDGLKSGARRVIWVARNGEKYKTATLAGATLPLHPHAPPEGTINTLAGTYINNIPLLDGYGSFGTRLNPNSFGAARYTSVKISKFTKDVMFCDIDLVPMIPNYDNTLEEPEYFIPLIPIMLLNSSEGIAIAHSSLILPRYLPDIIKQQIAYLNNKPVVNELPTICYGNDKQTGVKDENKWKFRGEWHELHSTAIKITALPYGVTHEKYINHLIKLQENDKIVDYIDDSKDVIDITVKFKRAELSKLMPEIRDGLTPLERLLKLETSITENMNVICNGKIVNMDFVSVIEWFTDWRLDWYVKRYERLLKLLTEEIQRYKDIIKAINKNVAGAAKKTVSRSELKEYLEAVGIINIDYIADLGIYRFTEEEKIKTKTKLDEALKIEKEYNKILGSNKLRKEIYIKELNEILENYKKGKYA